MNKKQSFILWFEDIGIKDVGLVGGKNASLGEMIRALGPRGVCIPGGFAVTVSAYRYFLKNSILRTSDVPDIDNKNFRTSNVQKLNLESFIKKKLARLDTKNLKDLARRGRIIREAIKNAEFPRDLEKEIVRAYKEMEKEYGKNVDVAVRSSATAEDAPAASFAGQMETYLNIRGSEEVLKAVKSAMASLFTNRAISYCVDKGFDHSKVALSVGVQKMVRSDLGCAGVAFTVDTESGFKNIVLINGAWGLGEMIVQGEVIPDEFLVFKPNLSTSDVDRFIPIIDKRLGVKQRKMIYARGGRGIKQTKVVPTTERERHSFILSDDEVLTLARWSVLIEDYYSKRSRRWTPMDIEWAKDGRTGELFIVQARPETVHAQRDFAKVREYKLEEQGKMLVSGASVGSKIATGRARVILDAKHIGVFKKGEVLVTDVTDPDWEPIMKIAAAIVTDKGGRTSHAAIVSRELGIPCIVGTGRATKKLKTGQIVTVDTTGSEGSVYAGVLKFSVTERDVRKLPKPKTKIMMNIATPETAFEKSFLPNSGVGLAREEFIIASEIGIHPLALIDFKKLGDRKLRVAIERKTRGWRDKVEFYVDKLAFGIAKIGAAFYPKPVIVRFSDFKTNEYRTLLGGGRYEPSEENPMIGWRGASRYYDPKFKAAFGLECKVLKKVRDEMGLKNIVPMIPFCRTPEEGKKVLKIMAAHGLKRIKVYVMCEIPSNILLADEFLKIFDGMSIGSNDLTQLVLGLDRDSGIVTHIANENNPAVKKMISEIIKKCRAQKKYIGICGQAPSDYPEFAEFLVKEGIKSISLNPDTVIKTILAIKKMEK